MNRREMIKSALLSAGAMTANGAVAQEVTRQDDFHGKHSYPLPSHHRGEGLMPNILWIVADEQRADTLGGFNNDIVHTPNLQRLMSQGVTFTNAFCQTPICSPSRASFLTGRYPHCTGLRANGQRIRPSERLVTRILADYDYNCALVGKLHLSPCMGGRNEQRIDDGYDLFWWSHDVTNQWPGQNQWYNWLDEKGIKLPPPPKKNENGIMPIKPEFTQTAWCADRAIQFMRQQQPYGQWLMSVNIFQPHHPFWPTEEYLSHYSAAKMPKPAYREGELSTKPRFQSVDHKGAYGGTAVSYTAMNDEERQGITASYYAMIEQVDTELGRMLDTLEETGQADNTIVIYMSDHGEMLGDHGIYLKGPYFYDCLTRVPLIIRWPKHFKAGLKVDSLVELMDLAPTLLDAANTPIPSAMQGKSLLPVLTGETTQHRDSVYTEYLDAAAIYDPPPLCTMVRTEKWKLSLYQTTAEGELYDLEKDPGEFNNLFNNPHHKDTQAEMMQKLAMRMIATTDPAPAREVGW